MRTAIGVRAAPLIISADPTGPSDCCSTSRPRLRALGCPGACRLRWTPEGDRNYLVLAKPNVIMNDIRIRGLAVPALTLRVGRAPTTTPRPLGTLDAPRGMQPLVPG
jgi:hypothetical protein